MAKSGCELEPAQQPPASLLSMAGARLPTAGDMTAECEMLGAAAGEPPFPFEPQQDFLADGSTWTPAAAADPKCTCFREQHCRQLPSLILCSTVGQDMHVQSAMPQC